MNSTPAPQTSGAQARNLSPIPPPAAGASAHTAIVVDAPTAPRPVAKRAAVWDDFEQVVGEEKVQCTHCGTQLSFKSAAITGTSSMSRHLESCKKKPCLEAGQQKLTFAKVTHNDKLRLHTLLEKWIIRDQQSLSVLDHPDFRVLLHALLAGYEPPTRNIMTRKIGVDFDVLKSQVKAELQAIPGRVALTTDGWTAGNGDQFQCITAHFIDGSWNLKTVLLDFAPFPVPHTAENAANLISAALEEFGITDKVSGCVTDNTASAYNISTILKRRMSPSPFLPARCASHLINLVVKHGLEDAGRDEIFGACRAFVTLLHRSKPTEKALVDACEEVGVKYVVPPTVMEVRWNSTLAQLAGLQRLEVALRHLFETPAYKNNAWAEPVWLAMRDIIKILTIF
ncbi:hypothetical protein CF326_g9831, partial [Tilletia indica]